MNVRQTLTTFSGLVWLTISVVLALPANGFTRGKYVVRFAGLGETQEWACESCSKVVTQEEKDDGVLCAEHRPSRPFTVPVVWEPD
jgi:hypothetical protein